MGIIKMGKTKEKTTACKTESAALTAKVGIERKKRNKKTISESLLHKGAAIVCECDADAYGRHYRLNNGTEKSVIAAKPVNYYDSEDREWKEIDNTLVERDGSFESTCGECTTALTKAELGNSVKIRRKDKQISWAFLGKQGSSAWSSANNAAATTLRIDNSIGKLGKTSSKAVYKDVAHNTDLEYRLCGNSIKENIIVKEKSDDYRYSFDLNIRDLKLRLAQNSQSIEVYSEEKVEFTIPCPRMYDASGTASEDIYYELQPGKAGEYTFTVVADAEWINAEERVLPVTIDPQVTVDQQSFLTAQVQGRPFCTVTVMRPDPDDPYGFKHPQECLETAYGTWYNANGYEDIKLEDSESPQIRTLLTFDKTLLHLREHRISAVRLFLTPIGEFGGGISLYDATHFEHGMGWYTFDSSDGQLELDITSAFKTTDDVVTVALMPDGITGQFSMTENPPVLEIEYLANENVKQTTQDFSLAGRASGRLNIETGELVTALPDVDAVGTLLGIGIAHVYKKDGSDFHLGKNFRSSLHEKLEKNTDSAMSADYLYTDTMGIKHGFKDKYYYLSEANKRQYVNKSEVSIDMDQVLSYTDWEGKVHRIYKEEFGPDGLRVVTELADFKNCSLIEQRHEKVYEIEERIKQLNKQRASYRHKIEYYTKQKESLSKQQSLTLLQQKIQELSNEMQAAQLQMEGYQNEQAYLDWKNKYEDFLQKSEDFQKTEAQVRLEKAGVESLTAQCETYLAGQPMHLPLFLNDAKDHMFTKAEHRDDDNLVREVFNFHYTNLINQARHSLEELAKNAENAEYTGKNPQKKTVKQFLLDAQQELLAKQREMLESTDTSNCKLQVEEIEYTLKQTNAEIAEIDTQLIKAEHERKTLLRQVPINYITDNSTIKGFNKDGDLVVIYDKYENYVAVEYEDSDLRADSEKYRILGLSDNNGKQIRFSYNNDDLLSSITDARGKKTKYDYKDGKLIGIEYADGEVVQLSYDGEDICSVRSTANRMVSEMAYEDDRLVSLCSFSTVAKIAHGAVTEMTDAEWKENGKIAQYTLDYATPLQTAITRDETTTEYYHFDEQHNKTAYYREEDGKVVQAEKYNYAVYVSDKTEYAQADKLHVAYAPDMDFGIADYDETLIDEFGNPEKATQYRRLDDTNESVCTVTYTYNDDRQCEKEESVTVKTVNGIQCAPVKEVVLYGYNAQGSVMRTESYIEGEEYTTGKTVEEMVYDEKGRVVKSFTYNTLDTSSKVYTQSECDENGKTVAEFDETGENKTKLEYMDGTDTVRTQILPNGSKISYGHDENGTVTAITQSTEAGEENSTQILYTGGEITELRSGNNVVHYAYDYKRRKTAVDLNGKSVDLNDKPHYITYAYDDNVVENGKAVNKVTATLCNGVTVQTVTDMPGNVLSVQYNSDPQAAYTAVYDKKGRLASRYVLGDGTTSYEYDSLDRIKTVQCGSKHENYTYYEDGNLATKTVNVDGVNAEYSYAYKTNVAKDLESVTVDGVTVMPQTDCLGRNTGKQISIGDEKIAEEYIAYRKVGDHATNMPSAMRFGNCVAAPVTPSTASVTPSEAEGSQTQFVMLDNLKYTYDNCGNITEVYENGKLAAKYAYDALSRLTREDNKQLCKTTLFTYDNNGNILSKREFPFTLKETALLEELASTDTLYAYDGDRLMSYGNETFAYDDLGNPTTYRSKACEWEKGRQLADYDGVTFTYDGRGRRTSKTAGGKTTQFTYDSSDNLLEQKDNTYTLAFIYDHEGVIGVKYDNQTYIYRRNAMGDIIALLDSNGVVVVKYVYDAWGNVEVRKPDGSALTSESHIGNLNPYRYRGYYYDIETELYYLNTRYYDPEVGRFITIDDISYLDPDTINGLNLYAYCANNPVINVDPNGTKWSWSNFFKGLGSVFAIAGGIFLCFVPGAQAIGAGLIITGVGGLVGGAIGAATGYGFGKGWNVGTLIGGTIGLMVAMPQLSNLTLKASIPAFGAIVGDGVMIIGDAIAISVPIGEMIISVATTGLGILFAKLSGKEMSSDKPSWVDRDMIDPNKSAQENAGDLLDSKYGKGKWIKGAKSEFNKIVKWIARKIFRR